jgi:hypothetical protein
MGGGSWSQRGQAMMTTSTSMRSTQRTATSNSLRQRRAKTLPRRSRVGLEKGSREPNLGWDRRSADRPITPAHISRQIGFGTASVGSPDASSRGSTCGAISLNQRLSGQHQVKEADRTGRYWTELLRQTRRGLSCEDAGHRLAPASLDAEEVRVRNPLTPTSGKLANVLFSYEPARRLRGHVRHG